MVVRAERPARHVLGSRALWADWREEGVSYMLLSIVVKEEARCRGEISGSGTGNNSDD